MKVQSDPVEARREVEEGLKRRVAYVSVEVECARLEMGVLLQLG